MPFHGLSEDFLKAMISESLDKAPAGHWNITRHYLYNRLQGILRPHDDPDKRCLCLSHSNFLAAVLGLRQTVIEEANFPQYDMLSLELPSDTYDFCISDQVLEHVEGNPFQAFEESARVVKDGGFVIHTTCFMNEIHGTPKDFWRFTPDALRLMARHSGIQVEESGGWGNKDVWGFMELGFRTVKVPGDPSHPICQMAMKNDEAIPIVTWVAGRKKSPAVIPIQ